MLLHEATNEYLREGVEINYPGWDVTTDDGALRIVTALEPTDPSKSMRITIYHLHLITGTISKFVPDDPQVLEWIPSINELTRTDWQPLDKSNWPQKEV